MSPNPAESPVEPTSPQPEEAAEEIKLFLTEDEVRMLSHKNYSELSAPQREQLRRTYEQEYTSPDPEANTLGHRDLAWKQLLSEEEQFEIHRLSNSLPISYLAFQPQRLEKLSDSQIKDLKRLDTLYAQQGAPTDWFSVYDAEMARRKVPVAEVANQSKLEKLRTWLKTT